jgi:pimeloyl-ACP methyl ester carboxylesterase
MEYEIHGEGFPLVMIMGLGGCLEWWGAPLIEELSKHYKTVIFDNRGVGKTDKPEIKYTIKMFADDTIGLMNALKIERAHVLGISMGGMIAQELVLDYPERVEKLVLCSTAANMGRILRFLARTMVWVYKGRMKTPEKTREMFIPQLFTKEFIEENRDKIEEAKQTVFKSMATYEEFKRQLMATIKFDSRKILKNIDKPVLIMHGKKDSMITYEASLKIAQLIPYPKLALFDNSAHALFTQEPEKVVTTLLEFLAESRKNSMIATDL